MFCNTAADGDKTKTLYRLLGMGSDELVRRLCSSFACFYRGLTGEILLFFIVNRQLFETLTINPVVR